METPCNMSGSLTEQIMEIFSKHSDDQIMEIDVTTYNKIYNHIYLVLYKGLNEDHFTCPDCGDKIETGLMCQRCP
jgi:hypothetical protein